MDAAVFRSLLAEAPLLADGGMGTSLIARGVPVDACMEELNVRAPTRVAEIHASFVGAGARLVLTNTFGANRYRLERHGLADRFAELCGAGVALARDAGAPIVAGSMGPLGIRLQPYGRVHPEDAFAAYREQAAALADAGVDLLVVETQSDLRELEQGVLGARDAAPDVALIASATFTRDDRTLLGSPPEEVAQTVGASYIRRRRSTSGRSPGRCWMRASPSSVAVAAPGPRTRPRSAPRCTIARRMSGLSSPRRITASGSSTWSRSPRRRSWRPSSRPVTSS